MDSVGSTTRMIAKQEARAAIDHAAPALLDLSHQIHSTPEVAFQETQASSWCVELLRASGFIVESGICGLRTAFRATRGSGALTIAVCAEYDALPDLGHACGHNIIAGAAVGTGVGLREVLDAIGVKLVILGTPAEEGGGGKIKMLERGGFDGVHAAMMIHPGPVELVGMSCRAVAHFEVRFHGKEAHASAYPEQGVNAADAMTIAQVAIGLLRQQSSPFDQVHGIVTHGGSAANTIPGEAIASYYARSRTLADLASWLPRVRSCFRAGALATGASVDFIDGPTYSEFEADEALTETYRQNAEAVGRVFGSSAVGMSASTDMANVSLVIPAIHPMLDIGCLPAVNHQPQFADACVTPAADRAVLEGAAAMAGTIIDIALSGEQRARLMSRARQRSPRGA